MTTTLRNFSISSARVGFVIVPVEPSAVVPARIRNVATQIQPGHAGIRHYVFTTEMFHAVVEPWLVAIPFEGNDRVSSMRSVATPTKSAPRHIETRVGWNYFGVFQRGVEAQGVIREDHGSFVRIADTRHAETKRELLTTRPVCISSETGEIIARVSITPERKGE